MAINPDNITTIRVDQLAEDTLNLTNDFAHSNGTELKKATIQALVDLVSTAIGSSSGVGYLAISVTDGQQLPDVPTEAGFFLAGAGTYLNINGYPDVICTENLNAIMSLTDHWELAVEIPINPLSGTVQSVTGSAVDNTDPLNPVINTTSGGVETIVAGTNITVDDTDPANPIVSSTASGFGNTLWSYKTKTSITSGDPLAGHLIWNNATQISATQLNLSHLVQDGFDVEIFFDYLNVGNTIIIQDKDDSTNSQIWEISSAVTIVPNSYVQVPVTLISSSGTGTTNFANNHDVFVVNQSVGGGAVDSVNGQTGVVSVGLDSVLTESNSATGLNIELYGTGSIILDPTSISVQVNGTDNSILSGGNIELQDSTTITTKVNVNKDKITRSKGGFSSDLVFTDPTANRTITFKDESGTVAYLTDISGATAYKFIQTSQTAHTGTILETALATATINGGSFSTSDVMKVLFGINKTGTGGAYSLRLRVNTLNTLVGATQIALFTPISASAQMAIMSRSFSLNGGNLYGYSFTGNAITDIASIGGALSSTAYNTANTLYLFFTVQLANAGDSITPNLTNITN